MEEQKPHSVDYLRLLRRVAVHRWKLVVAGFLVVALPTIAWVAVSMENTYEASATLFLVPERSDPGFLREFMSIEANALYLAILNAAHTPQKLEATLAVSNGPPHRLPIQADGCKQPDARNDDRLANGGMDRHATTRV